MQPLRIRAARRALKSCLPPISYPGSLLNRPLGKFLQPYCNAAALASFIVGTCRRLSIAARGYAWAALLYLTHAMAPANVNTATSELPSARSLTFDPCPIRCTTRDNPMDCSLSPHAQDNRNDHFPS